MFAVKHDDVCSIRRGGVRGDDLSTSPGSSLPGTMTVDALVNPVALSFFFLRLGSSLFIFSITMTERLSVEWLGGLKWAVTGFLLQMSLRCPLRRIWRGFCISPTYALPALDEVVNFPRLAGCCCSSVVGAAGSSAHESILGQDVLAGLALRVTPQTASLSLGIVRYLQSCTDPKVLGLAISHNGGFGYASYEAVGGMENCYLVRAVRHERLG